MADIQIIVTLVYNILYTVREVQPKSKISLFYVNLMFSSKTLYTL